jgi:hypothetical protein
MFAGPISRNFRLAMAVAKVGGASWSCDGGCADFACGAFVDCTDGLFAGFGSWLWDQVRAGIAKRAKRYKSNARLNILGKMRLINPLRFLNSALLIRS